MGDQQRLSYLHLMNKAAQSEDRQSYFHYLKMAEMVLKNAKREDGIWQPNHQSV